MPKDAGTALTENETRKSSEYFIFNRSCISKQLPCLFSNLCSSTWDWSMSIYRINAEVSWLNFKLFWDGNPYWIWTGRKSLNFFPGINSDSKGTFVWSSAAVCLGNSSPFIEEIRLGSTAWFWNGGRLGNTNSHVGDDRPTWGVWWRGGMVEQ